MRLYLDPGTCPRSPHLVAREAASDSELAGVDIATKRSGWGERYTPLARTSANGGGGRAGAGAEYANAKTGYRRSNSEGGISRHQAVAAFGFRF